VGWKVQFERRQEEPLFKHLRQKIDVVDQDQVIDRAGIGDYQPHGLQSQFFQRSTLFLKIFENVFFKHAVRLKEAIHLDTR
jgi:hypothetical protein